MNIPDTLGHGTLDLQGFELYPNGSWTMMKAGVHDKHADPYLWVRDLWNFMDNPMIIFSRLGTGSLRNIMQSKTPIIMWRVPKTIHS